MPDTIKGFGDIKSKLNSTNCQQPLKSQIIGLLPLLKLGLVLQAPVSLCQVVLFSQILPSHTAKSSSVVRVFL